MMVGIELHTVLILTPEIKRFRVIIVHNLMNNCYWLQK
ncbi:hypothetical protein HMPREF9135_0689 [Segatella baroniae F0067]|uniref:Uncharacterized protein n=1 Tax=Segatella baroniae F0067 TaxID=1115809 RepID=U2NLF8_9BACT|nr:hypothetical protein HMPREF9135_0689 [Segatella baroniae F0067]